jgi:hypothetical protein
MVDGVMDTSDKAEQGNAERLGVAVASSDIHPRHLRHRRTFFAVWGHACANDAC